MGGINFSATFFNIFQTLIIFINISLGLITFLNSPKKQINKIFALLTLAISIWMAGVISIRLWDPVSGAKLAFLGASLIPPFFLSFSLSFPLKDDSRLINIFKIIVYLSAFGLAAASLFTNLIVAKFIAFIPPGLGYIVEYGKLYSVFSMLFLSTAIIAIISLIRQFRESSGIQHVQAFYVLLGMSVAAVPAIITNLIIPLVTGKSVYSQFGPFAITIFVSFSFYAIIRHQLMDIKLILRQSFVYLASASTIIVFAISIEYFLIERIGEEISTWLEVMILIISVSAFPTLKNYYYHLANKYFFSSLYDSREVIIGLGEKLRSTLEAKKIYNIVSGCLVNSLHARAVSILTYEEKTGSYLIQHNKGFNIGRRKRFSGDSKLHHKFIKQNQSIVVEEIKGTPLAKNETIKMLIELGVEILTPLNHKDKTIGLIALGAKESRDIYNQEDLEVLEIIGGQTAIALENSLLYEATREFNLKLKEEVKKATSELRAANLQLKKLDAAKSEFISIASHQLRTPLTVIKGYISMMLDGSFGNLTKDELASLEKVYQSNERLIHLVENLLNISRIESGRLQFSYQAADLVNLVDSVYEELAGSAGQKGLKLSYRRPDKPLAKVKIDEEKIRQVVLNLIDNSIKYTEQGGITIKIEQLKNNIRFCVTDTGRGVSKEDLPNLFKKFYRGQGTALVHTEGTGLGLYISRTMIEAHQGKIWCESEGEGVGSKFCFSLPIIKNNKLNYD